MSVNINILNTVEVKLTMKSWWLRFTSSHFIAHVVQLLRFQLFDVVHKIFPVKEVTQSMFDLSIASWPARLHSKRKAQIYNLTHYIQWPSTTKLCSLCAHDAVMWEPSFSIYKLISHFTLSLSHMLLYCEKK